MNLHPLLGQRAGQSRPVRILLIGAGNSGRWPDVYLPESDAVSVRREMEQMFRTTS